MHLAIYLYQKKCKKFNIRRENVIVAVNHIQPRFSAYLFQPSYFLKWNIPNLPKNGTEFDLERTKVLIMPRRVNLNDIPRSYMLFSLTSADRATLLADTIFLQKSLMRLSNGRNLLKI